MEATIQTQRPSLIDVLGASKTPGFAEAQRILAKLQIAAQVFRVYAAGDPLAEVDGLGVRRETILFRDVRSKRLGTALLVGQEVHVRGGWQVWRVPK